MMIKVFNRIALSALVLGGLMTAPALADNTPTSAVSKNSIWSKIPDLSTDQIKKINHERLKFNKIASHLDGQIKVKQAEIQKQLLAVKSNPSYLKQLMSDKIAFETKLKQASIDHFVAVKKILTPQQLIALNNAIKKKQFN